MLLEIACAVAIIVAPPVMPRLRWRRKHRPRALALPAADEMVVTFRDQFMAGEVSISGRCTRCGCTPERCSDRCIRRLRGYV
jgi:hypothetical protein